MNRSMCFTAPLTKKKNVFTIAINVKPTEKKRKRELLNGLNALKLLNALCCQNKGRSACFLGVRKLIFNMLRVSPNGKNNTPKRSSEMPFTYWSQLFLHERDNPYPARQYEPFHKIDDARVRQTELILIKIAGYGYLCSPPCAPISGDAREKCHFAAMQYSAG